MTLSEIITQLESCGFTCEAGPLEKNAAFVALKAMAKEPAYTTEDLRDAFEQSRLTNPMVGFKYDTFEDFINAKID